MLNIFIDYSDRYEVGKRRCQYACIYFRADYCSIPTSRDGDFSLSNHSMLCILSSHKIVYHWTMIFLWNFVMLLMSSILFFHVFKVERVASMLNYFLLQLVGPQRKSLSLKDPEKYEFRPKHLLKQVGINYISKLFNVCFF